jgi:hypothetical protein
MPRQLTIHVFEEALSETQHRFAKVTAGSLMAPGAGPGTRRKPSCGRPFQRRSTASDRALTQLNVVAEPRRALAMAQMVTRRCGDVCAPTCRRPAVAGRVGAEEDGAAGRILLVTARRGRQAESLRARSRGRPVSAGRSTAAFEGLLTATCARACVRGDHQPTAFLVPFGLPSASPSRRPGPSRPARCWRISLANGVSRA